VYWKKVSLIGVGLLGGSLGAALRKRRMAGSVYGYVRRASSLAECKRYGATDEATMSLPEAVSRADLVVLCTPIGRMSGLMRQMLTALKPGAVITDVGSVKSCLVKELESLADKAGAHYVGSHPMAGAEKTGVSASRADLFKGAVCVITPTSKSNQRAVREVAMLWKSVGCKVMKLKPDQHDEFVSRSSHLPHVVAAELADYVLDPAWPSAQASLCANGFRDTTRIASSSPEMWRDIALGNRRHLSRALMDLVKNLQRFRKALKDNDQKEIASFFERARSRRDGWVRNGRAESME
jgi:prephenate dehydrogenase